MGASSDESTWVLTSYLVSNAIVLPITGWLVSLIGRKRFFLICISLFTVSSLFCGIAFIEYDLQKGDPDGEETETDIVDFALPEGLSLRKGGSSTYLMTRNKARRPTGRFIRKIHRQV